MSNLRTLSIPTLFATLAAGTLTGAPPALAAASCASIVAAADKEVSKAEEDVRNLKVMLSGILNAKKRGGSFDQIERDARAKLDRAKQTLNAAVANRTMVGARCSDK